MINKFLVIVVLLITFGVPSETSTISPSGKATELDLLYGEIVFFIRIPPEHNTCFNITYSIPPIYNNQTPIFFEILDDTTAEIISYKILNDTGVTNKVVRLNIAPDPYGDVPFVHFQCWVLVSNNEFNGFTRDAKIPSMDDLPDDVKIWLDPTQAVQSNNFLIQNKARSLMNTDDNLTLLAEEIVTYTSKNKMRPVLWLLANIIPINRHSDWAKFLDATSSLFFGGSCTGRANLGTALFRASGVPSRVLHVMPTWTWYFVEENNMWYDMHYISEYFSIENGWVLSETSIGITPLEQKQNIVLRVNYPDDENRAGNMLDYYGGCEQWFWTDEDINLYWTHKGSGTRSFYNNNITINEETAGFIFNITQKVYTLFTKYAGLNLSERNHQQFCNATRFQKKAIEAFKQLDIKGYHDNITLAYYEYTKICYP